ncbi:hypothetical protein [Shewanella fodinae]|jgi:hypothetical protein|uniref:hypothetical protein n=1 Tax=Shewanella fodinae TaxID=552357 RepID=UPI00167B53E3|nr:hypothetical protein [Shewanella fodinae]MCL2908249.1 hypothetical protein [Shewanella fodinae]GGZ14564.1 hypothetical protein GCM10007169_33800 [Shewanella fodinae]
MVHQYWDELYLYVKKEADGRWLGVELVGKDPDIFLQECDDFTEICTWRSQGPECEYYDPMLLIRLFIISWAKSLRGTTSWLKAQLLIYATDFQFKQPALRQLYTLFLESDKSLLRQLELTANDKNGLAQKSLVTAAESVLDEYQKRCEKLNRQYCGEQRCWQDTDWFSSISLEASLLRGSRKLRRSKDRNFNCYLAELFIAAIVVKEFYPESPLLHSLAIMPLRFPVSFDYSEHYFQRELLHFCLQQRGNRFLFEQLSRLAPEDFLYLCSKTTFTLSEGELLVRYFDEFYPDDELIGCSHTKAEYLQCFIDLGLIDPKLENANTVNGR